MQHGKSVTQRECNMKNVQNGKTAQRKEQPKKSARWKKCTMSKVHDGNGEAKEECNTGNVQHENSATWAKYRDRENLGKNVQRKSALCR